MHIDQRTKLTLNIVQYYHFSLLDWIMWATFQRSSIVSYMFAKQWNNPLKIVILIAFNKLCYIYKIRKKMILHFNDLKTFFSMIYIIWKRKLDRYKERWREENRKKGRVKRERDKQTDTERQTDRQKDRHTERETYHNKKRIDYIH